MLFYVTRAISRVDATREANNRDARPGTLVGKVETPNLPNRDPEGKEKLGAQGGTSEDLAKK